MSIDELDMKYNALQSLLAQIDQLQAEAEAIKDAFKAEMIERGEEVLNGTGWRATWKNTANSRFDTKRFRADHGDLYEAYTLHTTGTRFTVNSIKA